MNLRSQRKPQADASNGASAFGFVTCRAQLIDGLRAAPFLGKELMRE